ncbi:glycosyl hydrolase family 76-domain-containing protein [Gaertneriomyces semiglobifer]|nr:glycosyl hydrolase family 76-domain-containing protein [Gaertneriomyces semiglobifer]
MLLNIKTSALAALVLASGSSLAATVDVTNKAALGTATNKVVANLVSLYSAEKAAKKTSEGGWDQANTSWFASGIAWGTVFDNSLFTGDRSQDAVAGDAILEATFGDTGDLLGGALKTIQEKLRGKWNDDIAWWALSMMSAADVYGPTQVIPGGKKTFLEVAQLTHQHIVEQWSDATCNGGIYWSRDRQAARGAEYKSVITHGETITLSARLYKATKQQAYLQWGDILFRWLKDSGFVTANYEVLDGADAPCTTKDTKQWSYNAGMLLAGLSAMYEASQQQSYLDEAHNLFRASVTRFTKNNVVYEPLCDQAPQICGRDTPAFKPQYVKGLRELHRVTPDAAIKQQVQTVIDATVAAAAANCGDDWWCSKDWDVTGTPGRDFYNQYPTAELLVAAAAVHGGETDAANKGQGGLASLPSKPAADGGKKTENSAAGGAKATGALVVLAGVTSAIITAF